MGSRETSKNLRLMTTPLLQSQDESEDEEEDLLLPRMAVQRTSQSQSIFSLNRSVISLTFLSAVGGFLFGYDTGVVSGAMLLIEDDPEIQPNTLWKELIVSATVGAAWLFALIGGPINEYFGRKP